MSMSRFGLATAALAATACLSAPVSAADLYGSSIKDPPVVMSSPGHCYIRGDVGYSWSRDPSESIHANGPGPRLPNQQGDGHWPR